MAKRVLSTLSISFGDKYEPEKMRVLMEQLNRLFSEFQRIQSVLSEGSTDQVLTKLSGRDYAITWADPGSAGTFDAPVLVTVADPSVPQARVFVADANYFTTVDAGAGGDYTLSLKQNGVAYDRIQQVTGRSVLGNPNGALGDVQEITASVNGTVLTLVAGVLQFASFAVVVASYFTDSAEIAWTYDPVTDTISASLVANSVAFNKLQQIPTSRLLGRATAGTGDIEALTGTQATAMLDEFTDVLKGLVPPPITTSGLFLSDTGTWQAADWTGIIGIPETVEKLGIIGPPASDAILGWDFAGDDYTWMVGLTVDANGAWNFAASAVGSTLTIQDNVSTTTAALTIIGSAAAATFGLVYNNNALALSLFDFSNGSGIMNIGISGTGFGTYLSGGPSGPMGILSTDVAYPIVLGTNLVARLRIGLDGTNEFYATSTGVTLTVNQAVGSPGLVVQGAITGAVAVATFNSSASTTSHSRFFNSNGTDLAIFDLTGTGFTGAPVPGGATGAGVASLYTSTGKPLQFGTNNTIRMSFDGTTGAISAPVDALWSGSHLFNGVVITSVATAGISIGQSSGYAQLTAIAAGAPLNAKVWNFYVDAVDGRYVLRAINDAASNSRNALEFTRSGVAITGMVYGNATDNPPHTFYGQINGTFDAAYNATGFGALSLRAASNTAKHLWMGFDPSQDAGFIQATEDSVAHRPLWLNPSGGAVVVGASGSTAAHNIFGADFLTLTLTNSTAPWLRFSNPTAGTDTKYTYVGTTAGVFNIGFANDAFSTSRDFLYVTRSGIATVSMIYGNSTDSPIHTFYGEIRQQGVMASRAPSGFTQMRIGQIAAGYPGIQWDAAGGATNGKVWEMFQQSDGTRLAIYALDDAVTVDRVAWQATRSGVALTSLAYGNPTDNPIHDLYGQVNVSSTYETIPTAGNASHLFNIIVYGGGYGVLIGTQSSGDGYLQSQRIDGIATVYNFFMQPNGGVTIFPAAASGYASIRLPHGSAPSSPVNGDVWTTTAGIFVRVNGATVGPLT